MSDRLDSLQPLSESGAARSEAILREAVALGGTLARRRRVRRRAVIVAVPVLVAASLLALHRPAAPIAGHQPLLPTSRPVPSVPAIPRRIAVTIIQPDPTILERYATRPIHSTVVRIDDRELLHELAAAGMRGGIATVGDESIIVLDR